MKQKMIILCLAIIGALVILPHSCENNNEFDLYGDTQCDTTNITWESDISEILEINCVSCHGPVTSYRDVRHDSYSSELVVVNDGRLRGVVNHLPGFVQMPKDRPQLPECELMKINIWLDNGAPEK